VQSAGEWMKMTDEDAIKIAKLAERKGCGPVVKFNDDDLTKPHAIIAVDLLTKPPTVTRIDDPYPNLRL